MANVIGLPLAAGGEYRFWGGAGKAGTAPGEAVPDHFADDVRQTLPGYTPAYPGSKTNVVAFDLTGPLDLPCLPDCGLPDDQAQGWRNTVHRNGVYRQEYA